MKKTKKTKKIKKIKKVASRKVVRKSKSKRNISYMIFAFLLIAIMLVAAIINLNSLSSDRSQDQNNSLKLAADSLKTQAINNLHSNPTLAKSLLEQARQKYQQISDSNNIVDVDSQLYLIEHTR